MELEGIQVDIKPYAGPGQLRAFADVTARTPAGELTVRGYRVVSNKVGGLWVAAPSTTYTKDGQIKNKRVVDASRATERRISEAVMEAYRRATAN